MPQIDIPDTIKKYGGVVGKGFIAEMGPKVLKGTLLEVLKQKGTGVKSATEWVERDVCLWDTLEPGHQKVLISLGRKMRNISWLTAGWVIEAIKGDMPAVASLFLGWKKANNWLVRQVTIIKERVEA